MLQRSKIGYGNNVQNNDIYENQISLVRLWTLNQTDVKIQYVLLNRIYKLSWVISVALLS